MLLKMHTGLSGPLFSLAPGDEYEFDGEELDGEVTGEAGRLIAVGFATRAAAASAAPVTKKRGKADVVPDGGDAGTGDGAANA